MEIFRFYPKRGGFILKLKNNIGRQVFVFLIFLVWETSVIAAEPAYNIRKVTSVSAVNASGDNQYNVVNKWLSLPLTVQVIDEDENPVTGITVYFSFIENPGGAKGYRLSETKVLTDPAGIASTSVLLGSKDGEYEVAASINGNSGADLVVFNLFARKPSWFAIIIFSLAGGLGLFLYGMLLMSNGLQKSAGDKMRTILSKLTYNRFIAMLVGAFVTTVIQSSSATLVMLVSFVNSKLLKFRQSIGIFLGAAIGSTITAQIIAFNIAGYSLLFVGIGFFAMIFFKKPGLKNIGESVFGFGVLFFGMHIMSEAMAPLRFYEPFVNLLLKLENPIAGIIAGALLTALVQSSAAFIGILIILAGQGLLTLQASVPLIIGANLGTAITALLASIETSRESKQVAVAFTIFKAAGALILIWWIPSFVQLVEKIPVLFSKGHGTSAGQAAMLPRQIANAHTIYNLILAGVFLPVINLYDKFINHIFPLREEPESVLNTLYLDESMIRTPALALNLAKQEVIRLMDIVKDMTGLIIQPFLERKIQIIKNIEELETQVNFLRDRINEYILKITRQQISTASIEEAFQMMYAVKEFEQIGDIVASNLKEKAISWCRQNYAFSGQGKKELSEYHRMTLGQVQRAIDLYRNMSLKQAREVKEGYKEYRQYTFELEKQHFERLKGQVEESILSSKTHLELMTMFKAIGSHATNTARIVLQKKNK
ncbi:MAG: Na/Pi symporter [Bacteroidales bacterium]|nr:Na/Pi symporter [Bacteroidales bacterium]